MIPINLTFDPGKLGSYFQAEDLVERNLAKLSIANTGSGATSGRLPEWRQALSQAVAAGRGLYVTF
jgi:hypothetical protein